MSDYDEGYDEGYSAGKDELRERIAELEAARIAYASEFDGDVGNIHQNIRTLKKERDAAFNKGMERAAEIVREHGLFAEEHIRKEIDK